MNNQSTNAASACVGPHGLFYQEYLEMNNRIQRKVENSYLGQLERMLVQRLQQEPEEGLEPTRAQSKKRVDSHLNQLSVEMNEELDRLENMILEEQSKKPSVLNRLS